MTTPKAQDVCANPFCREWVEGPGHAYCRRHLLDAARADGTASSPKVMENDDSGRCAACGWLLCDRFEDGCVRGNCCMRPLPTAMYNEARYRREQGKPVPHSVPSASPPAPKGIDADLLTVMRKMRAGVQRAPKAHSVTLATDTFLALMDAIDGASVPPPAHPLPAGTTPQPPEGKPR
jgi:hypothetical protein